MKQPKPGSVIVCGGCSIAVPLDRWQQHRQVCWRLAEQLALSEELEPAVLAIEMAEDLQRGFGRKVDLPLVPCSTCGAQPGELCVNLEGGAMRTLHKRRRELQEEFEARHGDELTS